jgi:hypothetical protein
MNARIQGLYRLARGYRENPMGFMMKGVSMMAATLALMLHNEDREEYEELPEWDKDIYWHFWIQGEHFRLPKPFEVGAMFATVPERIVRGMQGRDSLGLLADRALVMVGETFAFNPIPQLLKPVIEQYANRDMFTGAPIIGLSLAGLKPEAQATAWTSPLMQEMAKGMPDWAPSWLRSPRRLEHALRGYFGTMGTYALSTADYGVRGAGLAPPAPERKLYDLPVVRRFWRDPNPRYTKYSDMMYELLDESNRVYRTINKYKKRGQIEEARALAIENKNLLQIRKGLNRLNTQVRKINEASRTIMYNQIMDPVEKRRRLDELTAKKIELTRQVAPYTDLL